MNFLQIIIEHWNIVSAALALVVGFALWHLSQRFVSKKEFETALADITKLRERQEQALAELSANILQLNAAITNMPSVAALHRLELGLEELRGLQKETAAQLKGQSAAMERLNDNFDRLVIKRGEA
ncbi:MAG: DUF2730 domain-containing protein [Desulfovibrionaceae bacterium]|nr:DUF2730 domain-containing protein [Desulfovibrionaceae bacterium]